MNAQVSVSLTQQPVLPCPPRYVTTYFGQPIIAATSAGCGETPACTLQVDNTRQFLYGNPAGGVVVDVVAQQS